MAAGSGMCMRDRCMLRKFRPQLVENLIIDEVFLSHMIQKGVLKTYDYEDIKLIPHSHDKVGRLLDYMERGGPHMFAYFIYTLNLTQPFLAEMLDRELAQRWKDVKDDTAEQMLLTELTEKNLQQEEDDMESIHRKISNISVDNPDVVIDNGHVSTRPNSYLTELIKELEKLLNQNQQLIMMSSTYYTICSAINVELTAVKEEVDSTDRGKKYLEYACYYSNDIMRLLPRITEIVEIYDAFWDLLLDVLCVISFKGVLLDSEVVKHATSCLAKKPECLTVMLTLHQIAFKSAKFLLCIDSFYTITKQLECRNQEISYLSCRILAFILQDSECVLPEVMKDDLVTKMWRTIKSWDVKSRMECVDTPRFRRCKDFLCSSEPILQFLAAWIMQYFIYQDTKRYVPLIERDVGIEPVRDLLTKEDLHLDIKTLLTPLLFQLS